ncbi:hypothetical protein ACIBAH_35760 [Streptomyces sp. NPDC051445]|uniref:hypothetical protein n=1 Tax=Streptomyces sp. NPDC051445 TaxID=3365653 RepID=UPI0037AF1BE2
MVQPPAPGEPVRLTVDALADRDQAPVSTALGRWVGEADHPDTTATLIDIHERVNDDDD